MIRWLVLEGWGISDELWKGGVSDADEPREKDVGIQCGTIPSELGYESGEAEAMEGLGLDYLIDEHQKLAVEGEEPGRASVRGRYGTIGHSVEGESEGSG